MQSETIKQTIESALAENPDASIDDLIEMARERIAIEVAHLPANLAQI